METKISHEDIGKLSSDAKIKNVELFADNILQIFSEPFSLNNEMRAEIREPLIDLLVEKGIEISPMQRLLIILGRHIQASQINFKIESEKKKSKEKGKKVRKS